MERMNRRYEAVSQPDGSWAVHEFVGGTTGSQALGFTKRDARSEAVRLNRGLLRDERLVREEKAAPRS